MARVKFYRPHNDRYETAKVEKIENGIVYLSNRIRIGKYHVHKNSFNLRLDELVAFSKAPNPDWHGTEPRPLVKLEGFKPFLG